MNQYEVILDILNYVKSNLFMDCEVNNFGGYGEDAYVDISLRNGDKVHLRVEYKKNEVKEDGN